MPIASGFSQDLNPNYFLRKHDRSGLIDETIYHKRNEQFERPVEIINRPVVKETTFMPDRKAPPLVSPRDSYTVYPVEAGPNNVPPGSFNIIRALGLNADCPCWSWILIVFGIIVLLALIGMCLYFLLERDGYLK